MKSSRLSKIEWKKEICLQFSVEYSVSIARLINKNNSTFFVCMGILFSAAFEKLAYLHKISVLFQHQYTILTSQKPNQSSC